MPYFDNLTDEELAARNIKRADLGSIKKTELVSLLEEHSGKTFIKEQSKVGKVIKTVYQQTGLKGFLTKPIRSRFINAMLTKMAGWEHRLKTSPEQIAKNARTLGITPYEVVKTATGESVFRGPKYLFGKTIAQYKNFNEFFVRDLTEVARGDYLRQSKIDNDNILENYD